MRTNKIYYLIPDIYSGKVNFKNLIKATLRFKTLKYLQSLRKIKKKSKNKAVGGIKVMLQHVMALQKNGFDAYPLKLGQYEGNVYGYDLEFLDYQDVVKDIKENDIVVSTEFSPYDGLRFPKSYKVLFMQNWINIKKMLKDKDKSRSYIDIGYDGVITCGEYNTKQVDLQMGISATTIRNGIDQSKFFPMPNKQIKNRVLCLSRKNYADFCNIKKLIGDDIDFRVVDGLSQDELISEYQSADIFLATGYPEGFSLPPIEAMLCGCAVVGFTGGGAQEYMHHNVTALVADDGDCIAAAKLLSLILGDEEIKERIRKGGKRIAEEYTLESMETRVVEYFKLLTDNLVSAHGHNENVC